MHKLYLWYIYHGFGGLIRQCFIITLIRISSIIVGSWLCTLMGSKLFVSSQMSSDSTNIGPMTDLLQ